MCELILTEAGVSYLCIFILTALVVLFRFNLLLLSACVTTGLLFFTYGNLIGENMAHLTHSTQQLLARAIFLALFFLVFLMLFLPKTQHEYMRQIHSLRDLKHLQTQRLFGINESLMKDKSVIIIRSHGTRWPSAKPNYKYRKLYQQSEI